MCQRSAEPACVIVKHANPWCGTGNDILKPITVLTKPTPSAFGGIIAFNREFRFATAEAIVSRRFVEVIIAPVVSEEAESRCCKSQCVCWNVVSGKVKPLALT